MMENRSFDHVLGWLPGADGRQGGLSYVDKDGVAPTRLGHSVRTFRAAPTEIRTTLGPALPSSTLTGAATVFLQTAKVGDRFPIGYYREDELPILSALAKGYTTFDNYFCSMMGPDLGEPPLPDHRDDAD
jgi:phospholipase C